MIRLNALTRPFSTFATAALAALALAPSALSQGSGFGDGIVNPALDRNGVDLPTGQFTISSPTISIGDSALSYAQLFSGDDWRHSLWGTISVVGNDRVVNLMGGSEYLSYQGGSQWAPEPVGGGDLSGYTYTAADGTVAVFIPAAGEEWWPSDQHDVIAVLSSLTSPNGERLDFHYNTVSFLAISGDPECPPFQICQEGGQPVLFTGRRLQSVTSNRGYQLHLQYAFNTASSLVEMPLWSSVSRATLFSNTVDYCAPIAFTCSYQRTWPHMTVGGGAGSSRSFTDAEGRTTTLYFNGPRVTGMRMPGSTSNDVTVAYDSNLRVQSVTAAGETTSYSYSDIGGVRTTTVTPPNGQAYLIETDLATGRVTASQNALGHRTTFEHDPVSQLLTRVTYPQGNTVEFSYDARGNLTERRRTPKPGWSFNDLVTSYVYPASCANPVTCNQPSSVTSPGGQTTDFTYDPTHGGLLTATGPASSAGGDRPQTRLAYAARYAWYKNASGQIVQAPSPVYLPTQSSTCSAGEAPACLNTDDETRQTYDFGPSGVANNLLLKSVTLAAGDGSPSALTLYGYNAVGDVEVVDGPISGSQDQIHFEYDLNRRRIGVVGPDPDGAGPLRHRARRTSYATRGGVASVETGTVNGYSHADFLAFQTLETVEQEYDSYGRPHFARLRDGGGAIQALVQYSYDFAGRLDCTARRMNPASFSSPPVSACSASAAGAYGSDRISRRNYDALNRVISTTTALGTADEAVEGLTTFTNNGRIEYVEDGAGNRTRYVGDAFDRTYRIEYAYPNNGGQIDLTDGQMWAYDNNGRIWRYQSRSGQNFDISYDQAGRVSAVVGPDGTMSYGYDLRGRVTQVAENGAVVTNGYDALGRRLFQTGANGQVSYLYNTAGQRTRLTWPDGFYVDYDRDATGALTALRENGASSGPGVLAGFSYDDFGRRTQITRGNGVVTSMNYDAASRLSDLTQDLVGTAHDYDVDFAYNPAHQVVSETRANAAYTWDEFVLGDISYDQNALNQITSVTGASAPTYDSRGNMISDGVDSFGFDARNRLAFGPNNSSFSYDPLGRLSRITGSQTRDFQYDGFNLIAEYDSGGAMQSRYVYDSDLGAPLMRYQGSGVSDRRWLITDRRGSVIAETNASGAAVHTNSYDEYGRPGSGNQGRFGFTGQLWLEDAGLYHMRNRAYHPELGVFMQADPIGQAGGLNIYSYVNADPMNGWDPLGLRMMCYSHRVLERWTEPGVTKARYRIVTTCFDDGFGGGGGDPWDPGFGGGGGGGGGSHPHDGDEEEDDGEPTYDPHEAGEEFMCTDQTQENGDTAGGILGGLGGAGGGALVGFATGGPPGAAVGATIGGIVGGSGGTHYGDDIACGGSATQYCRSEWSQVERELFDSREAHEFYEGDGRGRMEDRHAMAEAYMNSCRAAATGRE